MEIILKCGKIKEVFLKDNTVKLNLFQLLIIFVDQNNEIPEQVRNDKGLFFKKTSSSIIVRSRNLYKNLQSRRKFLITGSDHLL